MGVLYRVTIGDKATRVRAEAEAEAFDKALAKLYGRTASWLPDSFAPEYGTVYRHLTVRQGSAGRADFTTSITGRVGWSVRR